MIERKGTFSQRLDWLDRVACDPAMRGLPTAVAVLLAARYFNSVTGRAWPAQETLATALAGNRRSIQRALDALVEAGHLTRQCGGTGRKKRNSYWMRLKGGAEAASGDKDRRSTGTGEAAFTSQERRRADRLNKGKEQGEEHGEARTRQDTVGSGEVGRASSAQRSSFPAPESEHQPPRETKSPRTPRRSNLLPQGFAAGPAEFKIAQQCGGWDPERAKTEFDHFRSHHKAKGTQSHDWLATWEVWCRNGYKFDQRSALRGSSRVALRGLQRWLARQGGQDDLE